MDRPGREIPKDYRKVVTYLIEVQGKPTGRRLTRS